MTHAGRNSRGDAVEWYEPMWFQLTRPMRGATYMTDHVRHVSRNFNSHAPCGAQHIFREIYETEREFQLTRPMRGATHNNRTTCAYSFISTHTPHAGRNRKYPNTRWNWVISTHTPHAGRNRSSLFFSWIMNIFQLTRPMRGATQ